MNRTKSKNNGVTSDTLRHDVETLKGDVAELAEDARKYARQRVNGLTDTVKETATGAIERSRSVVGNEYDRALDFARQNPLASVSFGLVVGFALGTILRGRGN